MVEKSICILNPFTSGKHAVYRVRAPTKSRSDSHPGRNFITPKKLSVVRLSWLENIRAGNALLQYFLVVGLSSVHNASLVHYQFENISTSHNQANEKPPTRDQPNDNHAFIQSGQSALVADFPA